jgi:hypothetical protein
LIPDPNFLAGILMIINDTIALGLLYAIHLDGYKKYIVAVPEILLGICILYWDYKNKKI